MVDLESCLISVELWVLVAGQVLSSLSQFRPWLLVIYLLLISHLEMPPQLLSKIFIGGPQLVEAFLQHGLATVP